jgi:hypothetical protein
MIIMLTSSEFWVLVIIVLAAAGAVARYVVYKTSGKELNPGDSNLLVNLRNKLVKALMASTVLVSLEKAQGREAVRAEIANRIRAYVEQTDMLTRDEKDLVESLDITYLVSLIEKELIKLNVLKP